MSFNAVCNLAKASSPAITLNYPPVTAELMFSLVNIQRVLSGRRLHLHTSQLRPERWWLLQLKEARTNKNNHRVRSRHLMYWKVVNCHFHCAGDLPSRFKTAYLKPEFLPMANRGWLSWCQKEVWAYEKMTLLVTWFITSVNSFLKCLWSQAIVSSQGK